MMPNRTRLCLSCLISSLSLLGCDEQKAGPAPEMEKEPSSAAKTGGQTAPKAAVDASSTKPQENGPSGAACLPGKWHYDFADDALETMIGKLPGGKVTKEEGEIVCEIALSGSQGAVTCSVAGGKPVVIEIAADQSGMPLTLNMKMSGKSTSNFKLADAKSMQLTSDGIGDLKMEAEATIAGNKIPFPVQPMLQALSGEMGVTNTYECNGNELRLRPEVDAHSAWQTLKRLK